MPGPLATLVPGRAILLVVAAPAEARAVAAGLGGGGGSGCSASSWDWPLRHLAPNIDLLESGVGKANAAAAVALRADPARHTAVINLGVCGSLPVSPPLDLGQSILATSSVYADEGLASPGGFESIPQMGFPLGPFPGLAIAGHPVLLESLAPLADRSGPMATVSTCAGNDALARLVADRTGALAEAMEGAAIAHVLARLHPGMPFAEFRVVSNTTGDRANQRWDLRGALSRLSELTATLF